MTMINESLIQYMQPLQPARNNLYLLLEKIAKDEGIPIVALETAYFLQLMCSLNKPKHVLEIGTAIGYSTLWLLDHSTAQVETIEIDQERVERAEKLFTEVGYTDRVRVHHGDANDVLPSWKDMHTFDLVFVDAAKGQYIAYFEHIEALTKPGSIVITDNVFFHGMVPGITEPSKKLEPMVKKIHQFNQMLANHKGWQTTFYSIGDGVSVSIKVK